MELLQKFKQNGYFTAELYHLLAQKKLVDVSEPIIPSVYQKEMKMSTHERLQNLNNIFVDNLVVKGNKRPKELVLSFTPKILIIQNFRPNDRIVAKFSVKNISKAPTFLNMVYKESSYFYIKPCGAQLLSRLAPGISVTFAITFVPVQYEDYTHRVTFYTDTDQYALPIIAIGPRPIFDFPDSVTIQDVPLKVENNTIITVHNIGMVPAGFTLKTRCPFSVKPRSAYLSTNEKIEISVGFKTMTLGDIDGFLYAVFETGESFQIKTIGKTYTVSIELEKQVVRFLDTYNTMVRQQTYKIINKSDHVLTYMCMKNDCVYFDFEDKVKLATLLFNLKEKEAAKDMKLIHYDILSSDEHERVYTRIFFDEIQSLVADETLQFQNTHFSIFPIKGNLWPKKATELTITFAPKEIGEFSAIAYLDIDGVKDRLPLKMVGTSLPPNIQLNVETLDMDCVYINKMYNYEIVALNNGHINGVIVYKEVPTLFGSRISCSPEMHCLRPGQKETFVISFCNSNQGSYFEEINFVIRDTSVVLKLYLKGEVIYPSVVFSIPCLDFGMVSLGVPEERVLEVVNESTVDVRGSVKISSDGPEISSITLTDFAFAEHPKPLVPQWPREFNIEPSRIHIDPDSKMLLKVILTANLIRANQTSLELELEKSDSPPIILPVMYNAMVPEITVAPEIKLRACFRDYLYTDEIQIAANGFYGYFTIEEPEPGSTFKIDVKKKEGLIKPNSTINLPVTIKTSALGDQEYTVKLNLFGKTKPLEICRITGCGVRPIVTCTPTALHWGQVKLLNKSQKTLTLVNDSPVVVYFTVSLLSRDGRWQIEPNDGQIEPESEVDLVLSLYLIDADTYTNKAIIHLENVKDILVPLSATGIGTSIVVGELRDRIILGRHFTKIPLNCKVIMENHGTRLHSLEWNQYYKAPKTKQYATAFFNLEPKSFKMAAGEKLEMTVTGTSAKVATVKESWFLVGSVEGINKKELLMECQIIAEFVDPKIELSSSVVDLQYDFGPYSVYYKLTDVISIKNVSKLPLDIDLTVKPPFAIIRKHGTYKIPPEEEDRCCCIYYKECDLNVNTIIKEIGPTKSKPFIDFLTLKPVTPLRNEPLHFFEDINKIKMAFNFTHAIEETLDDQEVMKLQILFDTTKHLTLKSKVYSDLMRIRFKGHKNKDAIKLIGTVNFPNMIVLTPRVDFQCIVNGSVESKTIQIQNLTPLVVCYKLNWRKSFITTTPMAELSELEITKIHDEPTVTSEESVVEETVCEEDKIDLQLPIPTISKLGKYPSFEKEITTPVEGFDSISLEDTIAELEFQKQRILQKITPMIDVESESEFPWPSKFKKIPRKNKIDLNNVFTLAPHRGLLSPKETQFIHVIFRPTRNINVKAILEFEILGGPPEIVTVSGQSSNLMYKVNTNKLNFKIRSFHEHASEKLVITNIAPLAFEYKTYLNEPVFENELQGTILDLIPPNKVLESEEETSMDIVMRPGVVGYFQRVFLLEIGHLPHIPIEVFGWGVVPQVYLTLSRPQIATLDPVLGYQAIQSLTIDYLAAINEIFTKETTEHLNSPNLDRCFEDPHFSYGWHICSSADGYPSVMDIELAIERMLVINHIKQRPEILTMYSTTSKTGPIPGFQTTPYVIDYGVVITGCTVHSSADIINYGPIPTKLHFSKGTVVPPWLSIKLCGKLNPGESGKMEVVFSPTSEYFTELEQNVEASMNLEMPYGITIPLQIKSLCAVPFLVSNVTEINFGLVRCGDKIVCSIPLKNVGKPTCIWYVTLILKAPGPNPITVFDSGGKYEPGEGGWLSVSFKPTMEMTYEGVLVFRFHMNPNKVTIPVIGQGIIPQVHIIGPNVIFPPTLPWADITDIYFGLTNPCPFPIEIIVAHIDKRWKEDEEIYQLLHKYYNKPQEMLVPAIRPGKGLAPEILNFYRMFKERVQRTIEEEVAAAKAVSARASVAPKKIKSPKGGGKNKEVTPAKETSPRKFRSEAEIIADEIKALKENNVDPLKECLHVFDETTTTTETEKNIKGLLVFLHGSPGEEMQSQEIAYSLGMGLGIPTINFDSTVVEALCTCECPVQELLLSAINECYNIARKYTRTNTDDDVDDEGDDDFHETEDEFTIVQKKIEFLIVNKNLGTPRSKTSDKKKKTLNPSVTSQTAMKAMGSTTVFQMDLIQELLTEFFNKPKFNRGFVVDSLTSTMVNNPPLVLTTLLRSKSNIRNIHLVLCQSDFNKWVQSYEEALKENELTDDAPKVYEEAEIKNIVSTFQDMDDEEYENAPADLRAIYIQHGLEQRRQKHYQKVGYSESEAGKKDKASVKDKSIKSITAIPTSESKKKIKREEGKAKPPNEYLIMSSKYNEYYKVTYDNLINVANNWIIEEGDIAYPLIGLNGQIIGTQQKKMKKKSDVVLQASDEILTEKGFPLTLIMCPCLHYKKALVNMFKNAPCISQALQEDKEENILSMPVEKKEYSVLIPKVFPAIHHEEPLLWHFLDESPIKKCKCNQLTDINLVDDSTQDNVLNILSKWHCTCGKKVVSSQTSTSEIPSASLEKITHESDSNENFYPQPLPLRQVHTITATEGRIVLEPGDLVRCKFSFSPREEGIFNLKRFVEVSGWPDSRVDVIVSGICDLPRLDSRPKKMFEHFARRTIEDKVYKTTYLDDQKVFEFGPIFIGQNRIYEEEYTIDLRNASLMMTDVVIEFLEDSYVFQIDKTNITLEPGCKGKVTISAAPADVDVHSTVLLFCIRDNPEIVTINIRCSGVVPVVDILPSSKFIDYGRQLLYRREDDRFIIKNDSILPIMWKIENASDFVEDFIIATTTGIVKRHDNQVVPVTYIACQVGVISNKTLTLEIYDELGRGSPLLVDTLFLSAECYDVLIECVFENPAENFLNYGNVKVNSYVYREMYLMNKGKYNIYFKLKKVKNFPEPSLLKSFQAIPECGVIPPMQKLACIEFECTPTTSMNLVNVPAYTCSLLDGSKEQVVVAKFPVCVSIASFYNTFTLFPLGELNFNVIAVGSGAKRDVILNNTSKCPVTYDIILPQKYQTDLEVHPATSRLKDNRIVKNAPIRCGNFVIINEDNLLAPGTSRQIEIQFLATAPRKFEETINFIISDTCPAEAQGVPLKLIGTGALPTLDFWNVETTFREHLIVKTLDEYKVHESSPHCVFVENSATLYFFCVIVNTSHTAYLDLYNNGLVACALTIKLVYQSNSTPEIFSLDKYETHIEPLLHKNVGIIFSPKALKEYRAILQINLKLLDNQEETFTICLIGEGVIPRIRLISPPVRQNNIALLNFPVTCLGSISSKLIRFRNITSVLTMVRLEVLHTTVEQRPVFWMNVTDQCEHMLMLGNQGCENSRLQLVVTPDSVASIIVYYNPLKRGKTSCDVKLTILDNPYEFYNVLCEAEAFMEDVVLIGLEMLSLDIDLDDFKTSTEVTYSSSGTSDSRKKVRSAPPDKKKSAGQTKKSKKMSINSMRQSDSALTDNSLLKYVLNFGGCELCALQKRSIIMANNSEKVYKFSWELVEYVVVKPSNGYISPGEEKDLEILFFANQPVNLKKELISCNLTAISDDSLTMDIKGTTWDSRQVITLFDRNREEGLNERYEVPMEEQMLAPPEQFLGSITIIVMYSAVTQYTKYQCSLKDEKRLKDTFIYQTRSFEFNVDNVGNVPMKITWSFNIDEEYPARIDKYKKMRQSQIEDTSIGDGTMDGSQPLVENKETSKITLFSEESQRDSVDTWFEVDLPFTIEPAKECLKPNESKKFKVTFAPLEAFHFKVALRSFIDNLDPYDQNICCKITAKSLIPYVHLGIEESNYLTSGRRKETEIPLPPHMTVLEFNVLGWGCYKKTFDVINPTCEAYEFIFETVLSEQPELVPVHCNKLKGYIEGGTSTDVTFTFSPTAPGVYESQWKFLIPKYNLTLNLLVVGIVREPEVIFVPSLLLIKNSLVGFTTTNTVILKNLENDTLNFEFKGNSLCNEESGQVTVFVEPERGVMKPLSENPIRITYTPLQDGPLSFKIFCSITFMTKNLALCVNALSYSIKPKVTYYLIGHEHTLNSDVITNIYLDQTASTYERKIPFTIKNDGSATFFFDWNYVHSAVKKYLIVSVEPKRGHVTPGNEVECILSFTLKQVPVQAFPVNLFISDGPEYTIYLHAEIKKPDYHFSCTDVDFGMCFINAPDVTYKRNIAFNNDDKVPIIIDLNFKEIPELFIDFHPPPYIPPGDKLKLPIYFRPKQVRQYEFKLQFWVNTLCEEIVTIKGEGIPLLFDLYEGCQKSFDLGPVRVGSKIVRTIEVINHSKVEIEASFIFKDMYPVIHDTANSDTTSVCLSPSATMNIIGKPDKEPKAPSRAQMLQHYRDGKVRERIAQDITNALSSLKVIPNKCNIKPYKKAPLKIQFKPVGMISNLDVQLNMKVLSFERPLVKLSGSATGMYLYFNQSSLQFGRVRLRGVKILKVMLINKGDFGARFWWQPLKSDEFTISPQNGHIAAHTNVTFTITFRPFNHNPFIKVWASCNIENYKPLELSMYATCLDMGEVQNRNLTLECPVREVQTQYVIVTNPTDDQWLILSEVSGGPFDTLNKFVVEPNSKFEIPVNFRPITIGRHEGVVMYSPLGESALFVTCVGIAGHPNPNGQIEITIPAKEKHTEKLLVYNVSEYPETYIASTEVVKTIPDKFAGFFEIKHAEKVKTWGEAAATCHWTFVCYEECEMHLKVVFVNEETREYQYYFIIVTITPSEIVDTLVFTSRAREIAQKEILIVNPLSVEAEYQIKCDKLSHVGPIRIQPSSEAKAQLSYSPLVVGSSEDYLEIVNNLAGKLVYKVILQCLPAKEKDMEVTTSLGTCIPLRMRVQNRSDFKTEFITTVSHPSIQIEKDYILEANEKGKFLVWFEPTELGVQHCRLSFDSPDAGEFVFNIKGIGAEPKPQGPYEIKAGGFTTITFKNIFEEVSTFKINVDREDFYVKTRFETIKGKKDIKIPVYLSDRPSSGWDIMPTGTLTIETYDPGAPKVSWNYFLQGKI